MHNNLRTQITLILRKKRRRGHPHRLWNATRQTLTLITLNTRQELREKFRTQLRSHESCVGFVLVTCRDKCGKQNHFVRRFVKVSERQGTDSFQCGMWRFAPQKCALILRVVNTVMCEECEKTLDQRFLLGVSNHVLQRVFLQDELKGLTEKMMKVIL